MLREAGINLRAIDAVADEQNWNALANLLTERREPIDPRGAVGFLTPTDLGRYVICYGPPAGVDADPGWSRGRSRLERPNRTCTAGHLST